MECNLVFDPIYVLQQVLIALAYSLVLLVKEGSKDKM